MGWIYSCRGPGKIKIWKLLSVTTNLGIDFLFVLLFLITTKNRDNFA
jgi:hypothetical protein